MGYTVQNFNHQLDFSGSTTRAIGKKQMDNHIIKKYAVVVCFFTLPWIVFSSIFLIYSIIGITKPTFTMKSDIYTRYQTNNGFWGCTPSTVCVRKNTDGTIPTEQQVTAKRLLALRQEIDKERMTSQQNAIKSMLFLLGFVIVYFFHWRLSRRESE